ncbi:bromodomain-containing protein DDB_G0270170 isoform X3 [Drosophila hydei]|uniref:Bromodomain-containing protein DDB_G0270170 isoform X3 n=1 Tax=Drosophila hydei TaxID=7224 RepID=A0A6J1MFR2_DROHY|nr:bromodomain-containing protein DDB_G0270170 isoform X3 [Drosophila hydei]
MAANTLAASNAAPLTPTTPATPTTPTTPVDSPAQQLNNSVDSGIAVLDVDHQAVKRRQRLQQCQRILQLLQRDQPTYQQLRDRLSKIVTKKPKKLNGSDEQCSCNVCCAELDLSSAKNYVTCCTCGKQVCRGIKCANWLPKAAQWVCELCHSSKQSLEQTSSWVAEQMSFNQQKFVYPLRTRSEIYIPISAELADSSMHFESVSQVGMNTNMSLDERSRIREYVEEIVAEMLGGNLDHIKVGQLSKSENYLQLFDKFHAKLSNMFINVENALCARVYKGDLPAIVNGHNNNSSNNNNNNNDQLADISQTRLRTLIESIIAETLRSGSNSLKTPSGAVSEISLDTRSNGQLSGFQNNNNKRRHRTEHYFEPKIYQDLLATAVLNKIADKEGNTRLITESTPDLSTHNIDENYNAEALSTTSGSSIEPRSDCSLTDHELGVNAGKSEKHAGLQLDMERESVLSDYIAAHMVPLPDFSASVTESEDDIISMSSSMVGDGTWEDNWLFKKKRSTLQSSGTPSSIGMLVPAPKENIRAQIGDRTADEVSDLSEMGSDAEETSLDLLRCDNALNDRLLSKHLIGGQNTKLVLDELVDRTSLTSNTLPAEHEPAFTETTNPLVQQPMKTSKLLVPPPPMSFQDDDEDEIDDTAQKPIAGSIAEREVKKWYNAVEMPNNPYAPEALKQRISGTQERFMDVPNISPSAEHKALALMANAANNGEQEPAKEDYKRYSRDYYINNAPLATTPTRTASLACSSSSNRSTEPADEDIVINEALKTSQAAVEQPEAPLQQEQDKLPDMSTDNKCIYTALPAQVLDAGSLDSQSNQSVLTTSDDSDTVRIYDFNKQETTVLKTSTSTTTSSMESALGGAATTNTSSSSAADANSNSSSIDASRKRERPVVLQFGPADTTPNVCSSPTVTPTRGSTPPAFRFLQPKRRLIEPSQVLSIDDDEMPEATTTPLDKPAIEDDVVHALPSVKALAQAFLLTSKRVQPERRWRAKTLQHHAKLMTPPPDTPEKPSTPQSRRQMLQHAVSMAEVADESTISSDLSSLETDPSLHSDGQPLAIPIASPASPVPVRRGFLRSNIAFFENLKFK